MISVALVLQVFYVIFAVWAMTVAFKHSKKLASRIQKMYIEEAKDRAINHPEPFKGGFFLTILQIGIIFASFVILAMAYSTLFGPVVLQ